MPMGKFIEIKNINYKYNKGRTVFNDFSIEINKLIQYLNKDK